MTMVSIAVFFSCRSCVVRCDRRGNEGNAFRCSREISIEKVGVESKDTVAVTGAFFVVAMVCSGAINEAGGFEGVEKNEFRCGRTKVIGNVSSCGNGVCL